MPPLLMHYKVKKIMPSVTPKKTEIASEPKKPEIWFDDVDPDLLDPVDRPEADKNPTGSKNLVKEKAYKGKEITYPDDLCSLTNN